MAIESAVASRLFPAPVSPEIMLKPSQKESEELSTSTKFLR
jgi:hypothetical protein